MDITDIDWLDEIVAKLESKHGVTPDEVIELLENDDPAAHFRFVENGTREGENVYAALGQTDAGRYLVVFFIYKANRHALVVSARDMSDRERKLYERR